MIGFSYYNPADLIFLLNDDFTLVITKEDWSSKKERVLFVVGVKQLDDYKLSKLKQVKVIVFDTPKNLTSRNIKPLDASQQPNGNWIAKNISKLNFVKLLHKTKSGIGGD